MTSNKQKNRVTQTKTKGTANPDSQNQRQMLLLKLRIIIQIGQMEREAKHIQFDISALRYNPTLLAAQLTMKKTARISPNQATLAEARAQKQNTNTQHWGAKTRTYISTQLETV